MQDPFTFVWQHWPALWQIAVGIPVALLWSAFWLSLAGWLQVSRDWPTGYTRKLYHFAIFFSAAAVQVTGGLPLVFVFGSGVSLPILYAVLRGENHPWYEAMAREQDRPHRTLLIVIPYFATLTGGLVTNLFFAGAATIGYLVAGIGDALGEPVGTRFGRHRYRAITLTGFWSYRSVEGSMAVFSGAGLATAIGLVVTGPGDMLPSAVLLVFGIALSATLVEAISPRGWDNFFLQVVPAWLVWMVV